MSVLGLKLARQFGESLPAFAGQAQAEAVLFQQHDTKLKKLVELAESSSTFVTDFKPESLKQLESWYFELWESEGFEQLSVTCEEFETCMADYFGEVVVRNCSGAHWVVQEYAFERGKYEIGVQRGSLHLVLHRFTDHFKTPNNKRRQNLYGKFNKYFCHQ